MLSVLKLVFVVITIVTILLNLVSFVFSILLLTNSNTFSKFVQDLKRNMSSSPLFDIFVSDSDCLQQSDGYLLGYFEGTSSGCDCRYSLLSALSRGRLNLDTK